MTESYGWLRLLGSHSDPTAISTRTAAVRTNVKWKSNGNAMSFVSDHASILAPVAGPMAFPMEENVIERPFTRPHSTVGTELLIKRKQETTQIFPKQALVPRIPSIVGQN